MIKEDPCSYVMTTQEKILLDRYEQPHLILAYDVAMLKAAYLRYEEAESARMHALATAPPYPMSFGMPKDSAISFLFTVIDVELDHNTQDRDTLKKVWHPPDTCESIRPSIKEQPTGKIYRWEEGVVRRWDDLDTSGYNLSTSLEDRLTFSTYTVITDESNSFVCVPFDARRGEVRNSIRQGWRYLGFDHITSNSDPTRRSIFSKVVASGQRERLAGYKDDRSGWIQHIFPRIYQSVMPEDKDKPQMNHVGLVGQLALIVALAAFTASAHKFDEEVCRKFSSGRRWDSIGEVLYARM